jgi:hypothetical protein
MQSTFPKDISHKIKKEYLGDMELVGKYPYWLEHDGVLSFNWKRYGRHGFDDKQAFYLIEEFLLKLHIILNKKFKNEPNYDMKDFCFNSGYLTLQTFYSCIGNKYK